MPKIGRLIQTHSVLIRSYHIVQFIAIPVMADHLPLLSEAFKSQAGHCGPEAIAGEIIQVTPDHSLLLTKIN